MQASWKTQYAVLRPSQSDENLPTQMVTHTHMPVQFFDFSGLFLQRLLKSSNALQVSCGECGVNELD